MAEPPDHHQYPGVLLYRETLEFFQAAIGFYHRLLQDEVAEIDRDLDLKLFLTSDEIGANPVRDELRKADRVLNWVQTQLKDDDRFGAAPPMTHGLVRYLKAVGELYLKQLQFRREAIAVRPNISRVSLSTIDQKLSTLREKLESGVFKESTSERLLVDEVVPEPHTLVPAAAPRPGISWNHDPKPFVLDSIQIVDSELRARCLDLLRQFSESGEHDRLDTVVSDATKILEIRLRDLSRAAPDVVGIDLAKHALAGDKPRILLSPVASEQEAAHLLFRGVFGFVRNRVHHQRVSDLSPVRALQIVATMDYLLSLLDSVEVQP